MILINQLKKNDDLIRDLVCNVNENELHISHFGSNSILFILGHILYSRFYTLNVLGNMSKGKLGHFFEYPSSFVKEKKYPSVLYIESEHSLCASLLYQELEKINDEQLVKIRTEKNLLKQDTFFSFILSIIRHETFHLGQIQIMKKNLSHKASKFLF